MSGSIHRMVIVRALYFIFRLCSYMKINNVSPEYLKARGLRERMRSIWELFLVRWGTDKAGLHCWQEKKKRKKAVGGEGNKKKKKSLTPAPTLHVYKAFSPPWVTINPPGVLNNELHFTQGETEGHPVEGGVFKAPRGFWNLDGNHVSSSFLLVILLGYIMRQFSQKSL